MGTAYVFDLRFPGQYFDRETSTHYNYYREYDPGIGRYIETDPLGLRRVSPYPYAKANPLRFEDRFGLEAREPAECFCSVPRTRIRRWTESAGIA